ncbi:MAG TPA: ferritin-like domain-containing protein [Burkholderiales bacterium]|nr:ferritin-like domain-containing protein [Burkholderiales bacterium]
MNQTGIVIAPEFANKMMENTDLTKPPRGDEQALAKVRMEYGKEADPVGTLPDPQLTGVKAVLMDKLGERLAFERTGTRLYDALIAKCQAAKSDIPAKDLQHIRDEEHVHFALVGAAIQSLGGDPTAQTPAADVTGVEGMGLMQVLTDPSTTVAQALHAILVAELADNEAWEELIELTEQAGNEDLVARFEKARDEEMEHLEKVRAWYKEATLKGKEATLNG